MPRNLPRESWCTRLGVTARLSQIAVNKGYLTKEHAKGVAQTMKLAPTTTRKFGNYEILGKVGQGGMGVVYKARQVSLDRTVALKLLPAELSRNREYLDRFARESRAVAKLNHTNIIQVHDAGEIEGRHYFAMEFVDGESVGDLIEREGPLPEGRAIDITIQMARALEHAQTAGLVHRDIKPHNIMLTTDGVAKLADLGLAKSVAAKTSVAHTDNIVGTPHYMSPEQIEADQSLDVRSDIYSLGATLYHMATGVPPFGGATYATVLYQHMNKPVPDPRDRRAAISDGLAQVIYKMMAKKAGDRYQTPRELFEDLLLVRGGRPPALAKEAPSEGAPKPLEVPVRAARPPVSVEPAEERTSLARAAMLSVPVFLLLLAGYLAYRTLWRASGRPIETAKKGASTSVLTTVPAVRPEVNWESQLQQILAYENQNPGQYTEIIRRLTALASDAPGTEVAKKARERLQAVEHAREAEAGTTLQDLVQQAEKLGREGKKEEALALLDGLPRGLLIPSIQAKIAEAKDRIANLQASVEPTKPPPSGGLVVKTTMKQFLDEFLKLTRAGKSEDAKQLCADAQQQEGYKDIADQIRQVAQDLNRIDGVYDLAEAHLRKQLNKVMKVGKLEGKLTAVEDRKVKIEPAENVSMTQDLLRVDAATILDWALKELDAGDPQSLVLCGLFRLYCGLKGAKKDFEQAEEQGVKLPDYLADVLAGEGARRVASIAWQKLKDFPVTGYQYDPVIHNDHIYVIGGYNGVKFNTSHYASVDKDGSLSPWKETVSLPKPCQGPGVTVHEDQIYVALEFGDVYRSQVNADGTLAGWKSEPQAAPYRGGRLMLEAYKGHLYVFGGAHYGNFPDVYVARINRDGSLAGWKMTTMKPVPLLHQSVHFLNDRGYMVGGHTDSGGVQDRAYSAPVKADGSLGEWREEARLPHPLWYHNSVLVGEQIILLGGRTGYSGGPSTRIYRGIISSSDGRISSWSPIGDMPDEWVLAPGAAYSSRCGMVFLVGGGSQGSTTAKVRRGVLH